MSVLDGTDALLLDLDGVVYTGALAVPGAAASLARARSAGLPMRFVTNNASRTPEQVAARLVGVGVTADPLEVLTSAQAAARLLADRDDVTAGCVVAVVGGPGLLEAVAHHGYEAVPVRDVQSLPGALVQGFHHEIGWIDLAAATRWIRGGAPWVASNLDETIPTDTGISPGNGLLVHVVAVAARRRPDAVAGKPEPVMFTLAADGCGASSAVVVGDRLDTDIAGGNAAGMRTVLVLTGVHGLLDALAAPVELRPGLLLRDLRELWEDADVAVDSGDGWFACGSGRARYDDHWHLQGDPTPALGRAVLAAGWAHLDRPAGGGEGARSSWRDDPALLELDAALRLSAG